MTSPVVQYTSAGLAELLSAKNQGLKGAVTHIGAGDRSYKPVASQTALVNERQRMAIVDYDEPSSLQLRMAAYFDGNLEYEVREIGFYLASGTLLAVYSVPGVLLTYKSANSNWLQVFTLDISPLPTSSVTIQVGNQPANILIANELAIMAAANVQNMARHVELLFRVNDLQNKAG